MFTFFSWRRCGKAISLGWCDGLTFYQDLDCPHFSGSPFIHPGLWFLTSWLLHGPNGCWSSSHHIPILESRKDEGGVGKDNNHISQWSQLRFVSLLTDPQAALQCTPLWSELGHITTPSAAQETRKYSLLTGVIESNLLLRKKGRMDTRRQLVASATDSSPKRDIGAVSSWRGRELRMLLQALLFLRLESTYSLLLKCSYDAPSSSQSRCRWLMLSPGERLFSPIQLMTCESFLFRWLNSHVETIGSFSYDLQYWFDERNWGH